MRSVSRVAAVRNSYLPSWVWAALIGAAFAAAGRPAAGLVVCPGDCDGDGQVTVTEIVAAVDAALAAAPPACGTLDTDGDGVIQVPDLVAIVGMAMGGCPPPVDAVIKNAEAFGLTVRIDGEVAPGVSVTLSDALAAPRDGGIEEHPATDVYYRGVTDAAGRIDATVAIRAGIDALDVVVSAPDAVGPYTVEALRGFWGPFAPAARVTVVRGFTSDLAIDLRGVR